MEHKSEETIQGLLDLPKNEVVSLLEAGYFSMQLNRAKHAHDIFQGVAALVPHSDVPLIALGNLYFAQGKFEAALKEHEKALERDSKSALAHAHIGEIHFFQKNFDDGIAALHKAIELDGDGLVAKFAKELLKAHELHLFD